MRHLISVIVPVYNVEQYLKECIHSILKQTYQNFEMILVDDGSTDRSGEICDEYSLKDERIKVIQKVNGGLSSARNTGIEEAKGSFFAFIDSDDYIDKVFLEALYHQLMEKDADICECSFFRLKHNKLIPERLFHSETLDNETAVRRLFASPYESFVVTWNKLYKKSLFEKIRFPEGKLQEDEFTTYKLLYQSRKIAYVNQNLYIYRIRENSIMKSGRSVEKAEALDSIGEIEAYFQHHKVNMRNEIIFHEFSLQIVLLNLMVESNHYNPQLWKRIKNNIRRNKKILFHSPFLKRGHKIYLIAILLGKTAYVAFQKCVAVYKGLQDQIY